jgi:hypothetical protein
MKFIIVKTFHLIIALSLLSIVTTAQPTGSKKDNRILVGIPVNYQPDQLSNNNWYLLLKKRKGVMLQLNQTFVLRGVYRTTVADTATVGVGKVEAIQKDFVSALFFPSGGVPKEGDIAFLLVGGLKARKDMFFHLGRYHIELTTVTDSLLFTADDALQNWNTNRTNAVVKAIQKDLAFTVKAMREQGDDNQDQTITKGRFKGKTVFEVMGNANTTDIQQFLSFLYAYKHLYWGKLWKASEVYATWLANGAIY